MVWGLGLSVHHLYLIGDSLRLGIIGVWGLGCRVQALKTMA